MFDHKKVRRQIESFNIERNMNLSLKIDIPNPKVSSKALMKNTG